MPIMLQTFSTGVSIILLHKLPEFTEVWEVPTYLSAGDFLNPLGPGQLSIKKSHWTRAVNFDTFHSSYPMRFFLKTHLVKDPFFSSVDLRRSLLYGLSVLMYELYLQ